MAETVIKIEYDTDEAQKNVDDLALKIDGLTESNKVYQKAVKDARADLKKTDDQLAQEGKTRENLINTIQKGTIKLSRNKDEIAAARKQRSQSIREIKGEQTAFEKLTSAIEDSNAETKKQSTILADMKGSLNNFGDSLTKIPGPIGGIVSGLGAMTKASLSFIATPLGAILAVIVGAVTALVGVFKRSEDRMNKVRVLTGKISGIFKGLQKILEPLVDFLIDGVVKAFDAVGKAIDTTITYLEKLLRFAGWDSAANKLKVYTEQVAETAKQAGILAEKEAELQKAQRNTRLIQLQYQKDAEKLRQIRDDESKSIDDRIKANKELGAVLQKQLKEELAIAQLALEVANKRIEVDGETTETLDARAEVLTEIADIQERITGQESEQLVNVNSLLKEKADLEKAEIERKEKLAKAEQDKLDKESEALKKTNEEAEILAKQKEEQEALRRGKAIEKLAELKQKELELEAKSFEDKRNLQIKASEDELLNIKGQKDILNEEIELAEFEHKQRLQDIEAEYQDNISNQRQLALDQAKANFQEIINATAGMAGERVSIMTDAFGKLATINFKEVTSAKEGFMQIGQAAQGLTNLIIAGNQKQLDDLQAKKDAELEAAGENTQAKERIERKFAKKLAALKKQQFIEDKVKSIIDATISTALGVTKALGAAPPPLNFVLAGLVGAAGAVNIGLIARQKEPNFTSGNTFEQGGVIASGKSHAQGGINVWGDNGQYFGNVQGNEAMFVMKKDATAEIAAMSRINESHGGRSYFDRPVTYAEDGGQLSGNNIAKVVNEEIQRTPIFVKVGDIETGLTDMNNVKNAGVL